MDDEIKAILTPFGSCPYLVGIDKTGILNYLLDKEKWHRVKDTANNERQRTHQIPKGIKKMTAK